MPLINPLKIFSGRVLLGLDVDARVMMVSFVE
jgi:hypothetical protein